MPRTSSGPGSSREKLLDAAADLIAHHGVHNLTLDGVAAAAGVTKGGLIYHFKTKDDLLGALVARIVRELNHRSRAKAAKGGNTKSALLLALVDDTFDMSRTQKQLLANLFAAASAYPHLLGPLKSSFTRVYGQFIETGAHAGLALVLAAALDGILLVELLGLPAHETRGRVDAQGDVRADKRFK